MDPEERGREERADRGHHAERGAALPRPSGCNASAALPGCGTQESALLLTFFRTSREVVCCPSNLAMYLLWLSVPSSLTSSFVNWLLLCRCAVHPPAFLPSTRSSIRSRPTVSHP